MWIQRIVSMLLVFFVIGCNAPGVKPEISKSYFQEENLPTRTLRAVVVTTNDNGKAEEIVRNTSNLIKPQVGIDLAIIKTIVVSKGFGGLGPDDSITRLYDVTKNAGLKHGVDFDIAIGISRLSLFSYAAKILPIPTWYAAIDDDICRCYYVTKTTDKRFNSHEIMHAFIFNGVDHRGGLMSAMQFDIIPGVPVVGGGIYLLKEDRREVLRNKWRVMNELTDEQKSHMTLEDRMQTP